MPAYRRSTRCFNLCCVALVTLVFWVSMPEAQGGDLIKVTGSRYTGFIATEMAKLYMEQHPQTSISISHADHHAYVQRILENPDGIVITFGKLDEDLKKEAAEQGLELMEQVVGWGAIVLVVHPANPVRELTLAQIRKIFVGEYQNWNQLGGLDEPIQAVSRDESVSGTETLFGRLVLLDNSLAQQTVRLFDQDVCKAVSSKRGSIADARYPEAIRGRIAGLVTILAVKPDDASAAIIPSVETVQDRSYPISAPMLAYYSAAPRTAHPAEFVTFWAKRGLGSAVAKEK